MMVTCNLAHSRGLVTNTFHCINFLCRSKNLNHIAKTFRADTKRFPAIIFTRTNWTLHRNLPTMTKFEYPEARRDDTVFDEVHGQKIADPYRWLEDPDSEETKAFVDAQNAITTPFIHSSPVRQIIQDKLTKLWDYPKYSCPTRVKDRYYFYKNTGLQNQSVLYVQDTLDSEPKEFFDPNTLSSDGSVAIATCEFSEDGSIFAYALTASGSEWWTIHFMNAATGEKYPEVLKEVKYSCLTWTHDNAGVFYGRYPHQKDDIEGLETSKSEHQKLYYHRVGTLQSEDVLVLEFPENPLWRTGDAVVSDCGKYLFMFPTQECKDNRVYFTELEGVKIEGKLSYKKIVDVCDADYKYITNDGPKAIFLTNKNAPNGRLIGIDLNNYEEENWTVLIPEHPKNLLDWAAGVDRDKVVTCYVEDVKSVLQLHSLKTGELLKKFPVDVGTISGFSGHIKYSEIFFKFISFLTPGIIYMANVKNDDPPKILREIKVENFDPSLYETRQIFYSAKDGTKIPMFIIMKKDTVLDGSSAALLYVYGGFNINIQPSFSITRLIFMHHTNGILAIPNVRGGGEYGEKWYDAGRLFNKQNTFSDVHSAAEYLIENGYTSASKLTLNGSSNGGLVTLATGNQRPDLFGALVSQVPVTDMLRFHKFTCGFAWACDYGNIEKEKEFENMMKFSPLHNIRVPENGVQYPATLLLTADHDGRVVPLHSLKFIATLQHVVGRSPHQTKPLLISINTKAGHGSGKPTSKVIEEHADILTFIVKVLNLDFKED